LDNEKRELRMYFHGPAQGGQLSFLATSRDGLKFTAGREPLGPFYFRVFRWRGGWYAVAKEGVMLRSKDGVSKFEPGPQPFKFDDAALIVRHSAVLLEGDRLRVFYSRIGDAPERILVSTIALTDDWTKWQAIPPRDVLAPEKDYEGADRPLAPSRSGAAKGRARQLRDPGIFQESGKTYLLYSVAGESGIAIAELRM
jgi:hypothetical protein